MFFHVAAMGLYANRNTKGIGKRRPPPRRMVLRKPTSTIYLKLTCPKKHLWHNFMKIRSSFPEIWAKFGKNVLS